MKAFVYQWAIHEEVDERNEATSMIIHGYGLDEKNRNVCLCVENVFPWLSIELKNNTTMLSQTDMMQLKNFIKRYYKGPIQSDKLYQKKCKKLYFDQNNEKFPIIRVYFPTMTHRKRCYYNIRNKVFQKNDKKSFTLLLHEFEATPILQFLCRYDIPSCGWVEFPRCYKNGEKFTKNCIELSVPCRSLKKVQDMTVVPQFRFFSFDLEVYSSEDGRMPQSNLSTDVIFQIGVFTNHSGGVLLTLGDVPFTLEDITVLQYKDEKALLKGFVEILEKENPHVLMGYNIFQFDIPYLVDRCKRYQIPIDMIGMPKSKKAPYKEVKWSSSAYAFQQFFFLDLEGRLSIDLLPLVKRDYKFSNYKLSTVSDFFLGDTKDPMTPREIFRSYRIGVLQHKVKKVMRCGKYCVQDARLVYRLFEKLQAWIGLIEMAKICNVGIMPLFTQGQQIKIFSQVFKKCYQENRLVDSFSSVSIPENIVFDFDKYCGAFVFPPVPGKYEMVVPFDFTSLYPTVIISFNIDYSTLVYDENVPDEDCHVIEWDEEDGTHYRYRFRKKPIGVIPSLLMSLLQQRNETKRLLKQETDETAKVVFDKRQLAYKVSANSMYGGMGVRRGYLPFLPGAICTTARGRQSIQNAANFVREKHGGKIIYGDSVSADTIITLKEGTNVRLQTIEEVFSRFPKTAYPQFKPGHADLYEKEQSIIDSVSIAVYSRKGWAKVKRVVRHLTRKKMYKVFSSTGTVKVTEDHSLLLHDGQCIAPQTLLPGQHVLMSADSDLFAKVDYEKESWNGIWYISDQSIHFHSGMDDKYLQYIYMTYKKKYPSLVFRPNPSGGFHLDLFNRDKIPDGLIYKVECLGENSQFVYDVETEDGSFHAGLGSLIIKNTDSIYTHFPNYNTPQTVWEKAKSLEKEFLALFPPPMKLLFEEKIYRDFLILSKKRYMAYTCGEDGVLDEKMTTRGVLLARRDNCLWIRQFYEKLVRLLMENASLSKVIEVLHEEILSLFQWHPKHANVFQFVVSKLLSAEYKIKPLPEEKVKFEKRLKALDIFHDETDLLEKIEDINMFLQLDQIHREYREFKEDFVEKFASKNGDTISFSKKMMGNEATRNLLQSATTLDKCNLFCTWYMSQFPKQGYSENLVSQELKKLEQRWIGVPWINQYRIKAQPAHAQLNEKMKIRGTPVAVGSRMEYVIVEHFLDPKSKLFDKLEDPDYFSDHCDIYRLDRLYYVKSAQIPIDQLISVCFKKSNVFKTIYNYHVQFKKIQEEIRERTAPILHYHE